MTARDDVKMGMAVVIAAMVTMAVAVAPGWAGEKGGHIGGIDQTGGTVKGVVKFDGKQAKRKPIRMGADKFCDGAHKGAAAQEELYVFGDDNTLQNVFVWVSKGLEGQSFAADGKATIDQQGCVYIPHISGVVVDQELDILNSDNTLHNVKVNSKNNGSFNEGMPVKGMVLTKKFSKPEMPVAFKCDVHPWMGAFVHVVEHPFFAVTGQDGSFEIQGLPPGEYELSVWHEFKRFGPDKEFVKVTVKEQETAEVVFTYAPNKKKKKK